jgi:type I restriction enzyme, S subunit
MSKDLAKGWAIVPLNGLVASRKGKKPATLQKEPATGFVPYLDIEAIEMGTARRQAEVASSRVSTGKDVLVVWDGARSGWTGIGRPGAIGSTIMALEPQGCDRDYLYRFLQSQFDYINTNTRGTGIPHVDPEVFWNIKVPLPPLPEQERIVAKLEALLAKVDSCRKRLEKIPTLLKRFRQSVLAAACAGHLTVKWREGNTNYSKILNTGHAPDGFSVLPSTWCWEKLESVCEKVVDCPHSTPRWTNSGRLCVRTTNFKPGFLDLEGVRYVSEETYAERVERVCPQSGDILYSREGGILGIACPIPSKIELCLGQRMMLFRTKANLLGDMLMIWLNSPTVLRHVQELTGGSASPHLNVRDIKAFPIPIPPQAEQHEIVYRVEALFKIADRIEERYQKAKTQVDKLTQSILAKAFRGELVPQCPDDEPASALLEKIANEKAVLISQKKRMPAGKRATH